MREINWSLEARVMNFGVVRFLSFRITGRSQNTVIDSEPYLDSAISEFLQENAQLFQRSQGCKDKNNMEMFYIRYEPMRRREKIIDKLVKGYPMLTSTEDPSRLSKTTLDQDEGYSMQELLEPIPTEKEKRLEVSARGFASTGYNVYRLLEEIIFVLPVSAQLYLSLVNAKKKLGMLAHGEYVRQSHAIAALQREDTHQNEINAYIAVFNGRINMLRDNPEKRMLAIRRAIDLEQYSKLDALRRSYPEDITNVTIQPRR